MDIFAIRHVGRTTALDLLLLCKFWPNCTKETLTGFSVVFLENHVSIRIGLSLGFSPPFLLLTLQNGCVLVKSEKLTRINYETYKDMKKIKISRC